MKNAKIDNRCFKEFTISNKAFMNFNGITITGINEVLKFQNKLLGNFINTLNFDYVLNLHLKAKRKEK